MPSTVATRDTDVNKAEGVLVLLELTSNGRMGEWTISKHNNIQSGTLKFYVEKLSSVLEDGKRKLE